VVDDMPTYTLTMGGEKVTLYIDTGSELLLVDKEWLKDNFPSIYAKRYRGTSWTVKGVGDKEPSQMLVSNYQVQLPFEQTAKVGDGEVTSCLEHEALLVSKLGEPIIAGTSFQDAAEMTIHRNTVPSKRFITSNVFNDKQAGETRAQYETWKKVQTATSLRHAMRTTIVYKTLLDHQPKDSLEEEKLATVDALFRQDSSPAGRR
jgi:hypothetical protein